MDLLLQKWDTAMRRLEIAEAKYEKGGCAQRPTHRLGRCGWCGERVDTIDHLSQVVRDLNADIIDARQRALQVQFAPWTGIKLAGAEQTSAHMWACMCSPSASRCVALARPLICSSAASMCDGSK